LNTDAYTLEEKLLHYLVAKNPKKSIADFLGEILAEIGICNYEIRWLDFEKEEIWLSRNYAPQDASKSHLVYWEEKKILKYSFSSVQDISEYHTLLDLVAIYAYWQKMPNTDDTLALKKSLAYIAQKQEQLIPKKFETSSQVLASGLYLPNYRVGGDFYTIVPISTYKYGLILGDVSGKGVQAAIMMSHLMSYIQEVLCTYKSLEEAVVHINSKIYALSKGEKYVTLFLGVYNTLDRRLVYINSGHVPIPIYTSSQLDWLEKGTTLLGIYPQLPFIDLGKVYIREKTKLFLYSDGILNHNIDDEPFLSQSELEHILMVDCQEKSPYEIVEYFRQIEPTIEVDAVLRDDISILAIELS
jgi:phosphoserine phosphatase RsbU/P